MKINNRLIDTAYTRIDRFNAKIRWFNANSKNPHRIDTINAFIRSLDKETEYVNSLNRTIDAHIDFFNQLFPRVTSRLEKLAQDNSTGNKTIIIDWSTYMQVQQEFVDWGNHLIREYNLNITNMNAINHSINGAVRSFGK